VAEKDQFYSFEEALKELRLKEEELKRLVSEGEIRAFREGDTMKLRRADVENLRSELSGGEVVDLGEVTEELVFEDDADLAGETGMATEEIADVETIIEDDVEDVGEIEIEPAVEEAVVDTEVEAEIEADEEETAITRRRTEAAVVEGPTENGLVRAVLVLTSLILVLALPLCLSAGSGVMSGAAQAIASIFPHSAP
jgi:excisionase family DNA binding protein